MRAIKVTCFLLSLLGALLLRIDAQSPETEPKTFCSAAEIQMLIAQARTERKDGQAIVSKRILQLAPYHASLEYRPSIGKAATHEREAELMYVIEGAGTIVTGGALVQPVRIDDANLSGASIEGGNPRNLTKGDVVLVPENTPHWISATDGSLVLLTMHVPGKGPTPE
jgi:mannose-6-phosphate isomerase-like protein (cupin superfamily)